MDKMGSNALVGDKCEVEDAHGAPCGEPAKVRIHWPRTRLMVKVCSEHLRVHNG